MDLKPGEYADMKPEEYPTAHNIEAGNVNAALNHLFEVARQMTISAEVGHGRFVSGSGEEAEMTVKAVEVVRHATTIGLSDLVEDAEIMRNKFEIILSPAIDVRAPYAKVMVNMLVKAALGK
jgi:hypothetical protein